MSRFAMITEDPSYEPIDPDAEDQEDIIEWLDRKIEEATVAKKPQEPFSPYITSNS